MYEPLGAEAAPLFNTAEIQSCFNMTIIIVTKCNHGMYEAKAHKYILASHQARKNRTSDDNGMFISGIEYGVLYTYVHVLYIHTQYQSAFGKYKPLWHQ